MHIIYRLDVGGMENGLVNLVNRLPANKFSHVILCLTQATSFRQRIRRDDVEIIECRKPDGKHLPAYWKVFKELKRLRPDIVHTRNLGTLEMAWIAKLAGCRQRIHSEHGWSADDPQGQSRKYRILRRLCDLAVNRYVAVSHNIARWLVDVIGLANEKVETFHNGVDLSRFAPIADLSGEAIKVANLSARIVFGTLGRHDAIKGLDVFLTAVQALLVERPEWRGRIRVIMAGDGPETESCRRLRDEYVLGDVVEFPGVIEDVPLLLRQFDFFGPELVRDGVEGRLVPSGDADGLRMALAEYVDSEILRQRHEIAAQHRARDSFSFEIMCKSYERLYSQTFVAPFSTTS